MNTTKIAALYNPYVAQLLSIPTAASHEALMRILLTKREDSSLNSDCEIRVRNFDPQTVGFDQRCPQRVHAWAIKQFPEDDHKQPHGEAWSAMAADYSTKPEAFLVRFSSQADFAILLRGVQHYERKLNRQTRKLLAQLYAYHHIQCEAQAAALELAASQPQPAPVALSRFMSLRYRLATKIQQVATAAQAALIGEGQAV